jgi:dCMP deaminase
MSSHKDITKQERYDRAYLRMAAEWATLSHCNRKKVGALLVRDNMIISDGYNGTPSGFSNDCEDDNGDTNWYVLHAEANAIAKLARCTESGDGSTMFLTHAPCIDCAKQVYTAGIKKVYYRESYKDSQGLDFLAKCDIMVSKVEK